MKAIVESALDAWSKLVIWGGGFFTLAAVLLSLGPGDYKMAFFTLVVLLAFFGGLYYVPRALFRHFTRGPLPRTYRTKMDDGSTLIETVKIR